jgi:hypothetical protein
VARGHAARRRGVTAPTPIYEATAHDQGLDPATWAVLIRADIVKAPPAPESFDATAAVRRVLALAEDMAAAPRGEIMPASGAAILIRRAVEGES